MCDIFFCESAHLDSPQQHDVCWADNVSVWRVWECEAVYVLLVRIISMLVFLLLFRLNVNMTPTFQFPPAATAPNLRQIISAHLPNNIRLSGWRKTSALLSTCRPLHKCPMSLKHCLYAFSLVPVDKTSLTKEKREAVLSGKLPLCYLLPNIFSYVSYT